MGYGDVGKDYNFVDGIHYGKIKSLNIVANIMRFIVLILLYKKGLSHKLLSVFFALG